MPIKTILVPTDFSKNAQAAFETASDLARQLGARLEVLHVQDGSTLRVALQEGLLESATSESDVQAEIHKLTRMRFSSLMAGTHAADVEVNLVERRGEAEVEIVSYARESQAQMIVMGMRGATAWGALASFLLGSVTENVLRNAPCPTLIVRLAETA